MNKINDDDDDDLNSFSPHYRLGLT